MPKAREMLGEDDPVYERLESAIKTYETAYESIKSFFDRGKTIEAFDIESIDNFPQHIFRIKNFRLLWLFSLGQFTENTVLLHFQLILRESMLYKLLFIIIGVLLIDLCINWFCSNLLCCLWWLRNLLQSNRVLFYLSICFVWFS